jgi:hypothetical protein
MLTIVKEKGPMTHQDRIRRSLQKAERKDLHCLHGTGWGKRHTLAWEKGVHGDFNTSALPMMIRGWAKYADDHSAVFGSTIGEDYVLGDEWETIGRAIRGLLNGELGGLDGGTVDGLICEMLEAEGFDPDVGGRKKG